MDASNAVSSICRVALRRAWMLLVVVLAVAGAPAAAQNAAPRDGGKSIAKPSVYAVNAAALSAAMTYCSAKYRNINQGTAGADCFARARNALVDMKLAEWSSGIDRKCDSSASYNRCITPEIGRLVYALNDTFNARGF